MLVRPEGSVYAKYCLIGEAPGVTESRTGRPFVGKAGQKLDELLRRAGIARSECYITNVVKERPDKNNISLFINLGRTAVTSPAYDRYELELYQELSKVTSKIIVPLGGVALYALTRLYPITNWRGSILDYDKKKCIPTFHPSSALYTPSNAYIIMCDLLRAVEEAAMDTWPIYNDHFLLRPSYVDTISYLSSIQPGAAVAFDIEVMNNEVSCISFARSATDAICIPFRLGYKHYFDSNQELDVWLQIGRILEDKTITKIGQNLSFDCAFLFRRYGFNTVSCEDTMIAAGILYPDLPKGLDFLTSIYTKRPYYKGEGKKWKTMGSSPDSFFRYNALDSATCIEIFPQQVEDLKKQGNHKTYKRQVSLIPISVYIQSRGILMDTAQKTRVSKQMATEIEALTKELIQVVGHDINPNSPKQLATYFYGELGLKAYTKDGQITTDVNALKRLARQNIPAAKIVQKLRRLSKLHGTYFEMKIDPDNRLRCSVNLVGTTTGRISTSKNIMGTGGNMQNLPRSSDFKRLMIADPGCLLINVDLSQAENRIVAYIAPEHNMIEAFEKGTDIHSLTASKLLGKPIDQISREPGSCDLGTGEDSDRDWGKKGNHAINYGLGYKAFALKYEVSEKEAKILLNIIHSGYPGIRGSYHIWVSELLKSRVLTNCYDRRRLFIDADPEQAYAFIPQSTVADKINEDGLLYIWNNQDIFGIIEVLNQVHDSIVMQVEIAAGWSNIAHALLCLKKSLEAPIQWHNREFSIPVEVDIGLNIKDMKSVVLSTNIEEIAKHLKQTYMEVVNAAYIS